jgi:hypothetical protein
MLNSRPSAGRLERSELISAATICAPVRGLPPSHRVAPTNPSTQRRGDIIERAPSCQRQAVAGGLPQQVVGIAKARQAGPQGDRSTREREAMQQLRRGLGVERFDQRRCTRVAALSFLSSSLHVSLAR